MARARGYAVKSLDYDKECSEHFLSVVQKLYAIERNIKENNLTGEQVLPERKSISLRYRSMLKESAIQSRISFYCWLGFQTAAKNIFALILLFTLAGRQIVLAA